MLSLNLAKIVLWLNHNFAVIPRESLAQPWGSRMISEMPIGRTFKNSRNKLIHPGSNIFPSHRSDPRNDLAEFSVKAVVYKKVGKSAQNSAHNHHCFLRTLR